MNLNMAPPLHAVLQPTNPPPNPGPFGLCAFALTAFCMGLYNMHTGVDPHAPGNFITGTAMFYGGFGQVIAGLLEFRNGNTFSGTTFCSYGLYWVSYATLLIPSFGVAAAYEDYPEDYMTAVGIYLLGWTIFTFLMWTLTWRSNLASTALFFCLGMTYLFSAISSLAHLQPGNVVQKVGGGMGLITSGIAWYSAMADLSNSQNSYYTLPLGQLGRR
ncbi:GPR1/FUN34/yaaH family-domain-containing protein [Gamsiella multidivaricata]|uniref:GPR1/FUN34/yaaH family-domain-containing protein n=1 Tax=Gamsiella multidivaricata TaxID=101098 RepID=UPI00221F7457|nr:GPR1/FUN34/yaaH family-domain-containing protein [Gamsiella multidivaricata]KAI7821668.1 GPR1/FUN34/yaaH family-domain-containing protein [Gamsiella multidivaricata]